MSRTKAQNVEGDNVHGDEFPMRPVARWNDGCTRGSGKVKAEESFAFSCCRPLASGDIQPCLETFSIVTAVGRTGGTTGSWWVEVRRAAQHPTVHSPL